jgi:tetratricopeptide (TPR) repeat protein
MPAHILVGAPALHKASDYDGAITDFDRVVELKPCCSAAYVGRGSAYYDRAHLDGYDKPQLERAIADFKKAIELNPKSAVAYCHLGWAYEAIRDEREAIANFRKALRSTRRCKRRETTSSFWAHRPSPSLFPSRKSPRIETQFSPAPAGSRPP